MEKILVIQTAFIGDAILTLPMISILKERYKDSLIKVLCIPETKIIFENSPVVNEAIVMDKKGRDKSLISLFRFISLIKREKFNRIFSPHRSFRTSVLVKFSGVNETYGFSNSSFKSTYKHIIKYEGKKHEVQRNLDLIGYKYDKESWKIRPELNLSYKAGQGLNKFFVNYNAGSKIAVIAPGSVWNTKIYPEKYFREIIKYLLEKGFLVLLIGGKKDKYVCENLAEGFDENVQSSAGRISIIESAVILKQADLLVSNDSAPTHLGVSADIPVLTLYCSTIPEFGFYPYNSGSSYLSFDELSCKPCGIHGYEKCPLDTFDCGYKLTPDLVISKIEEILYGRN